MFILYDIGFKTKHSLPTRTLQLKNVLNFILLFMDFYELSLFRVTSVPLEKIDVSESVKYSHCAIRIL